MDDTAGRIIFPSLKNVELVFFTGTLGEPFMNLCPSTELRRVYNFDSAVGATFWLWLYRQIYLEQLHFTSSVDYDIEVPTNALPNLHYLYAPANIVRALMSGRQVGSLRFWNDLQSESSLRELLSYLTPTVHTLEINMHLQPHDLRLLFALVEERAPAMTRLQVAVQISSSYTCQALFQEVGLCP